MLGAQAPALIDRDIASFGDADERIVGLEIVGLDTPGQETLVEVLGDINAPGVDTEIIIQLVNAKARIVEIPIPTYYGDEICYVNGLGYARDAINSYFVFSMMKEKGVLPPHVRFQVSIPMVNSVLPPRIFPDVADLDKIMQPNAELGMNGQIGLPQR